MEGRGAGRKDKWLRRPSLPFAFRLLPPFVRSSSFLFLFIRFFFFLFLFLLPTRQPSSTFLATSIHFFLFCLIAHFNGLGCLHFFFCELLAHGHDEKNDKSRKWRIDCIDDGWRHFESFSNFARFFVFCSAAPRPIWTTCWFYFIFFFSFFFFSWLVYCPTQAGGQTRPSSLFSYLIQFDLISLFFKQ